MMVVFWLLLVWGTCAFDPSHWKAAEGNHQHLVSEALVWNETKPNFPSRFMAEGLRCTEDEREKCESVAKQLKTKNLQNALVTVVSRCPSNKGDDDTWIRGSGFAYEERLILTARHTASPPECRRVVGRWIVQGYDVPMRLVVEGLAQMIPVTPIDPPDVPQLLINAYGGDIYDADPSDGTRWGMVADYVALRVDTDFRFEQHFLLHEEPVQPKTPVVVFGTPAWRSTVNAGVYRRELPPKWLTYPYYTTLFHGWEVLLASFGYVTDRSDRAFTTTASCESGMSGGPVALVEDPQLVVGLHIGTVNAGYNSLHIATTNVGVQRVASWARQSVASAQQCGTGLPLGAGCAS